MGGEQTPNTLPPILYTNTTTAGTVGTGEQTLMTATIPANTLAKNGDVIEAEFWGTVTGNVSPNTYVRLKFGSTLILQTGIQTGASGAYWRNRATIVRSGVGTQKAITVFLPSNLSNNGTMLPSSLTEDETSDLNLFVTGDGLNNDDVTVEGMIVKYLPR